MYEPLAVDPVKCGLGAGEKCCGYLVMGSEFQCGRTLPGVAETIAARLFMGTMVAKYDPGALPYPECQEARA